MYNFNFGKTFKNTSFNFKQIEKVHNCYILFLNKEHARWCRVRYLLPENDTILSV